MQRKGAKILAQISEYSGNRLIEVGQGDGGQTGELPEGRRALWIITGSAVFRDQEGVTASWEAGETVYEVSGPGTLEFSPNARYVWLEPSDLLGFGPRALLYRTIMEPRNYGVGKALADGLSLPPDSLWADIGTGTGAMVKALRELSAPPGFIIGVDQSVRMLSQASDALEPAVPAWFVAQDVLTLTWPQNLFDGISALLLFHLVDHIEELMTRLFSALKPGGLLVYAVSSDANPFVRMIMRQLKGPGDFFRQGQGKIRECVLAAGFEVVRSEPYRDEIALENPEAMRTLISSIGGPASRGIRADIVPPKSIQRIFDLVWAQKPRSS